MAGHGYRAGRTPPADRSRTSRRSRPRGAIAPRQVTWRQRRAPLEARAEVDPRCGQAVEDDAELVVGIELDVRRGVDEEHPVLVSNRRLRRVGHRGDTGRDRRPVGHPTRPQRGELGAVVGREPHVVMADPRRRSADGGDDDEPAHRPTGPPHTAQGTVVRQQRSVDVLGVGVGDDDRRAESGPVDQLDAGHLARRRRDAGDVRPEADLGPHRGGHPEQRGAEGVETTAGVPAAEARLDVRDARQRRWRVVGRRPRVRRVPAGPLHEPGIGEVPGGMTVERRQGLDGAEVGR